MKVNTPRLGTSGPDVLTGTSTADFLFGQDGNDTLRGGDGDDWLTGHAITFSFPSTRNEIDHLHGGRGADTFVIARGYLGDGARGYALLADFNPKDGDRLMLAAGQAYTFARSPRGTDVFCGGDLVARLQGVNLGSGTINKQPWVVYA